jgi:hypothetical protein
MDGARSLRLSGSGAITTLIVSSPIRSIAFVETDDGLNQGSMLWYFSQFLEKYSFPANSFAETMLLPFVRKWISGDFLGLEPQDLMHHLTQLGQVEDV